MRLARIFLRAGKRSAGIASPARKPGRAHKLQEGSPYQPSVRSSASLPAYSLALPVHDRKEKRFSRPPHCCHRQPPSVASAWPSGNPVLPSSHLRRPPPVSSSHSINSAWLISLWVRASASFPGNNILRKITGQDGRARDESSRLRYDFGICAGGSLPVVSLSLTDCFDLCVE